MSSIRVSVEWTFGKITQLFAFPERNFLLNKLPSTLELDRYKLTVTLASTAHRLLYGAPTQCNKTNNIIRTLFIMKTKNFFESFTLNSSSLFVAGVPRVYNCVGHEYLHHDCVQSNKHQSLPHQHPQAQVGESFLV